MITSPEPSQAAIDRALCVLHRAGARGMLLDGGPVIGLWSDLDAPPVRAALDTLGMDAVPVRILDGDGVPDRYKVRRVPGQPVSLSRLRRMEAEL